MELGLVGKSALVGGGSSGLGRAVAESLAAEGCNVSIGGRNLDPLARASKDLLALGAGQVHYATTDIRDGGSRKAWVEAAAQEFGGLHIVIANAGGPPSGTALQYGLSDYRDAIDLSLLSQIGLIEDSLPHLRESGWGRIVFISSQTVRQPIPNLALSNTARPGILGYAKSLVSAVGSMGITVNVIAAGMHNTPRISEIAQQRGLTLEEMVDELEAGIPIGRLGEPSDLAAAVAFIVSERTPFLTGAVIPIDGGASNILL